MTLRKALSLGVAVWVCATLSAADKPSMSVFFRTAQVEERKDVDDATKNALKAKRDEAREARKALEKQLKDQLGKKRESWPPEKDDQLYRAEEAEALADADYEYRKIDTKALNDGLKDLVRAAEGKGMQAGKKDRITIAAAPAEADLVVEVMARRSAKILPTDFKPSRCYLLFSVGAGGKTSAAKFAKVPSDYRARSGLLSAWKIASPKPERPVFVFEGYNGGGNEFGCHGTAANAASAVIDKFIEDNYARIAGK